MGSGWCKRSRGPRNILQHPIKTEPEFRFRKLIEGDISRKGRNPVLKQLQPKVNFRGGDRFDVVVGQRFMLPRVSTGSLWHPVCKEFGA